MTKPSKDKEPMEPPRKQPRSERKRRRNPGTLIIRSPTHSSESEQEESPPLVPDPQVKSVNFSHSEVNYEIYLNYRVSN